MSSNPLISVLMAVFNGEKYLSEAIESILTQTYSNFEFLIINDGSTDKTEDIILSYSDNRIRYIRNANNLKLIASLNIGLSCAKGVYIARMDADDVALPSRLERQVAKLEENPNIGLLGSFVETLGLFSNYEIKFLTDHDNIRLKLFFNNYLNHPSVMIRRDVLVQNHIQYESFLHAEDYLLWLRLASCCQIEILPEILLKYRIHGENISQVNKDFQQAQTYELRKRQINELGLFPNERIFNIYNFFIDQDNLQSTSNLEVLIHFLEEIIFKNRNLKLLNESLLFHVFNKKINDYVELNSWRKDLDYGAYFNSIFAVSKINNLKIKVKHFFGLKKIS